MARIKPRFISCILFAILTSLTSCLPNPAPISDNSTVLDTTDPNVATSNQAITCFPIQQLPSDFHCHDALEQLATELNGEEGTIFRLTHLPVLSPRKMTLRVPYTWRSGSCDIVLTTVHRLPDVRVYAANLRTWARLLINTCVRDESHTGGGLLSVDFERGIVFKGNSLTFEAKLRPYSDTSADEDEESPGITPIGSGSLVPSS